MLLARRPEYGAAASLDAELTANGFEIAPEDESPAHQTNRASVLTPGTVLSAGRSGPIVLNVDGV